MCGKLLYLFAFAFLAVNNTNTMVMRTTEVDDTITTEYRSLKLCVVEKLKENMENILV
jgi:hypothetical protein